jgi:hypothetical protein
MNMNFGRLLAAGKSLIGMRNGETRYRQSKHVRLPKFISPKNPFIAAEKDEDVKPVVVAEITKRVEPAVVVEAPQSVTVTEVPKLSPTPARSQSKWLGGLTGKLNPFNSGRGSKSANGAAAARQAELALERVQVMRNDLSDLDNKNVQPQPKATVAGLPVMAMTLEKFEPVGAAWQRFAAKFTGTDQP